MSKATFMLGFIAGVTSGGGVVKEPVAYLYNGVRLPELPEWDKTAYPYAIIAQLSNDTYGTYYALVVTKMNPYHLENGVHFDTSDGKGGDPKKSYCYTPYSEWGEFAETYTWQMTKTVVWTNADILNEDGTVYLAASDPVPVYE